MNGPLPKVELGIIVVVEDQKAFKPCPFRYMESAFAEKLVPGMASKHWKIVSGCNSASTRILCTDTSKSPSLSSVIVVVSPRSNLKGYHIESV